MRTALERLRNTVRMTCQVIGREFSTLILNILAVIILQNQSTPKKISLVLDLHLYQVSKIILYVLSKC